MTENGNYGPSEAGTVVTGEETGRALGRHERRRLDRRGVHGRRQADHSYPCFTAPFIAHCLAQLWTEEGDAPTPAPHAARAYAQMKRRPD